jgi:20S proteasome subunit beta 1
MCSYPLSPPHFRIRTGELPEVDLAARIFQKICYSNKEQLMAGIIVGGWDPKVGGSVYNINLGGFMERSPWAIGGSGSTYIYGYCDATYKEGMTREECETFVLNGEHTDPNSPESPIEVGGKNMPAMLTSLLSFIQRPALSLAMSRDGSSGGVARLATINREGVFRRVVFGNELPRFWDRT